MTTDRQLLELAQRVAQYAQERGARLVTAESCTGGWIAKVLTDVTGSSGWLECGYVTYSDAAKSRDLGVAARTLERHGAVSEATAREMAAGALAASGAQIAIAVTGIAGPGGGSAEKPVGTVWICIGRRGADTARLGTSEGEIELITEGRLFGGSREAVRRLTVEHALQLLLKQA